METNENTMTATRRQFLASAALSAFPLALAGQEHGKESVNVLILKSDEHNPLYSSVYGHPFVQTPNMERLAKLGTVFENNYTPSPLCRPARSSWLSGLRVHQTQAYNNCSVFTSDFPSYGKVLGEQGIHTVHIGKVDGYNKAATLGFSEVLLPVDRPAPGDTNISRNPLAIRIDEDDARADGYGVRPNPYAGDNRAIEAAINWLKTTAPGLSKPWTLDVNITAPHFPHFVTQELWDLYTTREDLPRYGRGEASAQHPYAQDLRAHFLTDTFTETQIRGLRRGYYGCVTAADRQLGRLLDTLEETGRSKNTVVIYTSDHGEMLGKFGMWWKCSLYEDSARVPLIAAGPGFAADRRVTTPTDLLDAQAAIFHALKAKRPKEWAGHALQDLPRADANRPLFTEYHGHGTRASSYLLRKGRWKLLWYAAASPQLFDLQADPNELHNLADKEPKVFHSLEADLRRFCSPEKENQRAEDYIRKQIAAIKAKA